MQTLPGLRLYGFASHFSTNRIERTLTGNEHQPSRLYGLAVGGHHRRLIGSNNFSGHARLLYISLRVTFCEVERFALLDDGGTACAAGCVGRMALVSSSHALSHVMLRDVTADSGFALIHSQTAGFRDA